MKKIVILILTILILGGCGGYKVAKKYRASYKTINLKEDLKISKKSNASLIDVRTYDEYQKGHYDKAINIPFDNLKSITDKISKDDILIVYAKNEEESKKAVYALIDDGYSLVYDLGAYK